MHIKPNARITSLALRFSLAAATILGGAVLSAGCLADGTSDVDDEILGESEVVYEGEEQAAPSQYVHCATLDRSIDEMEMIEAEVAKHAAQFPQKPGGTATVTVVRGGRNQLVRAPLYNRFLVLAVNCTHLGCPVSWFPAAGLFLCPCHGGVYYEDGERASGPPPHGLYRYDYRVAKGSLQILAGHLPTLNNPLTPKRQA